jgi:opacity protein-like surface antigen
MKKILLTSTLVMGIFFQASAVDFYISDKISFSQINVKNNQIVYESPDRAFGTNENDAVLGNRLAVGFSVPADSIRGGIRAELEWGLNAKAKVNSGLVEMCNGGVCVPNTDDIGTNAEFTTNTFMLNAYYDLNTGTKFTPFVGFGAGLAHISARSDVYGLPDTPEQWTMGGRSTDTTFVWNIGIGTSYALTRNIALDVSYRFTDFGRPSNDMTYFSLDLDSPPDMMTSTTSSRGDMTSHEFMFGVRYTF